MFTKHISDQILNIIIYFRGLTFRKVYRHVGDLVIRLNVPVLALTATITKQMQYDIVQALHLDDECKVVAELPNRYTQIHK